MGGSRHKQMSRKAFLALPENHRCCYCGGVANEIDHFPPRFFFRDKQAPEGYIYPACSACNRGKSSDEQALALIISMLDWNVDNADSKFRDYIKAVRNNRPEVIAELKALSAVQSKRHLRHILGSANAVTSSGMNGWQAFQLGPVSVSLLHKMCIWFGQTLYFKHNKEILRGEVISTNLPWNSIKEEEFKNLIEKLSGVPSVIHTSHDISDQFFYRYFSVNGGFYAILQFKNPQMLFVLCALAECHITPDLNVDDGWFRSGLVGPPRSLASVEKRDSDQSNLSSPTGDEGTC